ncbi:MAG: hypothetical protein ABUL73_00115 [Alphaproteobacteria bacterium]
MAEKKTARLKVYATRIGIKEWVVAASSQKAALKAWDVRENLFAMGAAREVKDPDAIALALKTPGVPVPSPGQGKVRLPSGGNVVDLSKHRPAHAKTPAPTPPEPKKRDRTRLDAAELALRQHEREAKRKRADIERRRRLFEDELATEEAAIVRERASLETKLEKARQAYEDS